MPRLQLPTVTLCAAASVNVAATVAALQASLDQIDFNECLLFTHADFRPPPPGIRIIPIAPIETAQAYSEFVLKDLPNHVSTGHCLIVQWDGFVLDADQWDPDFLSYDYIGAPWPQFRDRHDVGNGGFSLRSRKLLEACWDPKFRTTHPEDMSICRVNRQMLEQEHGIRFAERSLAERFAFERAVPEEPTFGFHGIFNIIPALGTERFWSMYQTLDDRRTAFVDYPILMRQLEAGPNSLLRRLRLTFDRLMGSR
jgi:hypothetical protein